MNTLGIDEAGRGPVIGPMVMAGIVIPIDKHQELIDIGVKDSKLLSKQKRSKLFSFLTKNFSYKYYVITPREIDSHVFSSDSSLNMLELIYTVKLINHFDNIQRAIIDCPSTNIASYRNILLSKINKDIELVVEHSADKNHVEVGAASIIAKVIRDKLIDDLKQQIGIDFGSGYPSDPLTQDFLEKFFDKYDFFRKSWSSWSKYSKKDHSLKDYFTTHK